MPSDERGQNAAPELESPRRTLDTMLLGSPDIGDHWRYLTGLALGFFGVTFLAYELDIFYHSGGVVFIPYHAALVGGIAAFWAGYTRNGLVAGWGLTYASLLGMRAEWATNLSPRSLFDRGAHIVRLDGLLALAVIGVAVAVVGFIVGVFARRCINSLRAGPREDIETIE